MQPLGGGLFSPGNMPLEPGGRGMSCNPLPPHKPACRLCDTRLWNKESFVGEGCDFGGLGGTSQEGLVTSGSWR